MSSVYYSQFKQDQFLDKYFFKGKKEGVFVDVGAYNGIRDSNTYFFEKELNWSGICIEPLPHIFEKLMSNRTKNSRNIMCAITTENTFKPFIKNIGFCEPYSHLKEKYDTRYNELIENVKSGKGGFHEEINVKCHRLDTIFNQLKVDKIDYLSVDVVGSNLDVFKSIDFDKVYIHMISFECLVPATEKDIVDYLKTKGFVYVVRMGEDIIMIHEKSEYVPEDRNFTIEL